MNALSWLRLVALVVICAGEAFALSTAADDAITILARSAPPARQAPTRDAAARKIAAAPGGGAFLSTMTPDDVARGLGGLRALPPGAPEALAETAALAGALRRGAALRGRLGALREQRRAAEVAWMDRWLSVVGLIGAERARAAGAAP